MNTDPQPASQSLSHLPSVLAIPLREYFAESHPVLQLQRLCDAAEILTRFCTIVALGEWRAFLGGELPAELLEKLRPDITLPSFGDWKQMLQAAVQEPPRGAPLVVPELLAFVGQELLPNLGSSGASPDQGIIRLRNDLVHGGAMHPAYAQELLAVWRPRTSRLVEKLDFLTHSQLCVHAVDGPRLLVGPAAEGEKLTLSADLLLAVQNLVGHVLLIHGGRWLDLWPLCHYGRAAAHWRQDARQAGADSPMIYYRYASRRVQYAAIGADLPFAEREDAAADFKRLFQLEPPWKAATGSKMRSARTPPA